MLILRCVAWWSLSVVIMVLGSAFAQEFPNKPIRIVLPDAGSGSDFAARLIAPGLSASLGQQVVIDNRGAASGIIAAQTVAKAPPDGYTLLLYGSGIWLLPFLRDNVPYDPVKDFSPVTIPVSSPNILVVHPSLPVKSVKELIALAKAKPGELNYGAGSLSATPRLAAELFQRMAGVNMVLVAYRGTGPATNALLGGHVQLMFPTPGSVVTHIKSGRLRALAVTSAEPSVLLPGLPTVAASGVPGFAVRSDTGIFAPAKTPAAIINRLSHEIAQALSRPEVKERFLIAGVEPVGSSPETLAATVKSDLDKWGKIIKDAGIRSR